MNLKNCIKQRRDKAIQITGFVILLSIFASCIGKRMETQSEIKNSPKQLAVFLDKCLSEQPNALNNEVTRAILADTIRERLLKYQNDTLPILADLPMKYEMCLQYPPRIFETFEASFEKNAGKYVVKFSFGEYTSKIKLSSKYKTTFQVFTILEKETVATLVDGALYKINGKFRDFANNTQKTGFVLPSGKCIISFPSVISIDNSPYIDLGTLILDNISFSKIEATK